MHSPRRIQNPKGAVILIYSSLYGSKSGDSNLSWKTYRNTEYGFQISIPNSWIVDESPKDDFDLEKIDFFSGKSKALPDITFRDSSNRNDGQLGEKVNLNGLLWERYKGLDQRDSINYYMYVNGKEYEFTVYTSENETSLKQILSTASFL